MIIDDGLFEKIIDHKNEAFVYKNACDHTQMITWDLIERYINDFRHRGDVSIIGSEKQKTKKYKSFDGNYDVVKEIVTLINEGNSFVLDSMERYTKGLFYVSNIFSRIHNSHVSTNIYGGVKNTANSFYTHADSQYVLIIQLDGTSDWTIYKEVWDGNPDEMIIKEDNKLTVDISCILYPGDALNIPYRRYHKCIPQSKRLSASVSAGISFVRDKQYGDWFKFN